MVPRRISRLFFKALNREISRFSGNEMNFFFLFVLSSVYKLYLKVTMTT